ncbi:MAG: M10 family metallopeptidase C-terminal domain-containing protein [Caulobacter sp.]|nr:M10 family metallopeptidase C-terminal domain-containing protein [Caulobacter sp.]
MPFSGQMWYLTEGGDADTRLVRINDDGTGQTTVVSNGAAGTGDDKFISSFVGDLGVDTATGFYFALLSNEINDHAYLVRGSINSSAAPTTVIDFADNLIVQTIEVDAINRKIYVGVQDGSGTPNGAITGIKVYSYDAAGALTDNGYITTADTDNRADVSGFKVLDPQDFALDRTIVAGGRLFYSERVDGLTVGLYRLDLSNPNAATNMLAGGLFPGDGSNGQIIDVEVDETTDLLYFTTRSLHPSGTAGYDANDNAIWYISENASGGTPTKLTLTGMPANVFYGGDMTFDQSTRQIYVESGETDSNSTDDVIYVFQLDAGGTSASLIRTVSAGLTQNGAQIEGMTFADLAAITVTGSGATATEQGTQVTLLSGAPTITDNDGGYLTGATVQITGGTFSSNENSTADDHLGYGASQQISGTIAGTSITLSWNAATETLTLSGLDTIAHYQSALAGLVYWATGNNPTNYGANTTRTITWTISDGTIGVLAGSVNSTTSTISIAAVNDAPVNSASISATGSENADIAVTGLQISDVDANPASATMTVTLSVTKGILTLRTNVASGLTAGNITGNGTGSVTITGTANAINTTLAAANGLLFHGNTNVSGTDTLTVVTSDGGSTGTGGALTDTDGYTITIIGINDAPVVSGDGTESLAATNEDVSPSGFANTISSLFASQFSDADGDSIAGVAVVANGSTAGTGQWQYWNGSTWVNIGAASTSAAVELSALTAIRFAPAADFNGAAPTLTVRLVDSSAGGITNGAIVNTTTNGGTTVFSSGTVVLSHTVTDVNDAPVVINGAAVSLTSVAEDSAPGAGQTITSLFSSHFSDAKDTVAGGSSANLFAGVAVTANAATAAQGVYQYFDGSTWQDLPAVSTSNAFYISASTLVRFVPAADYSGTAPSLTVSMIEDSAGAVTTGQTADLTNVGGSTPYSTAMTLNVVVTPTNDAPIASGSATLNAIDEDLTNYVGVTVNSLFSGNFSDPDGDGLGGVAITGDASSTEGVWQYSLNSGASWTTIVSPSLSSAVLLAGTARLRFVPAADFNGPAPALTAHLIDNSGGAIASGTVVDITTNGGQTHYSSAGVDLNTTINPVNDAPVVPATATAVNATEQTAAILLGSVTVSDVDLDARNGGAGDYAGATFTVQRAVANANDSFAFDTSGASFTVVGGDILVGGLAVATFTSTGGVLTISFTSLGATATTALVNEIIDHITYTNGSDAPPASVSLNYSFNDGGGQGTGGALSGGGSVNVNIASVNDVHTGGASITGTAAEDSVLTAVSTLVDPDGIGALHYQWQRNTGSGFINVGTDASTYTLGDADIGGVVRVIISYTDAGGTAESATSSATASVVASNDAPTGGVSIAGTTTEDQVLTANTSTLADSDGLGTLHYDWQRNTGSGFVSTGAADQATYTLGDADVGATVRVVVSYTDGQGFANSVTSSATASIAGVNDPHTGGVSITGTATEDQVLTAVSTLADVDGLGTLHYDWQRNTGSGFVSTGAADQATYTLGDADVGATIRVVVSYTDGQGFSESATSSASAVIANVNDPHTGGASITGPANVGQTLTADTSTLADADGLGTLHYDWQRDTGSGFASIGAADQATYTLVGGDLGATIRVVVSYTDAHGTAESATSAATANVLPANGPHTGTVTITGTVTEDQVLTAVSTLADPGGLGTLHYDWQRDSGSGFVSIGAADQATYTLGDADVGKTIRVVVSYTDGQGVAESETSAATAVVANVNDAPTGAVAITGAAVEDQILTAVSTLADVDGLGTLHYDWQRDTGSGFVSIGAADQATYTLGDADVGAAIRVRVTYTDQHGTAEAVLSTATGAIANVNDAPSAANDANAVTQRLTVTGTVRANDGDIDNALNTLTVTNVAYNATHVDQAVSAGGAVVNGAYGQLTINPDGTYSYLANHEGLVVGQVVTDKFDYTIKDPSTASATAQLTITVTGSGTGDAGANTIISAGAGDTLTGRGGADTLTGGGGADTFVYESVNDSTVAAYDTITDFQHGVDKLQIAPVITGSTIVTLTTDGTDQRLYIDQNGDGTAESLILSKGQGLQVTDILTGVAGFGFTIVGSAGADVLRGGSGADRLTGGAGADTFVYGVGDSATAAPDVITDFQSGVDKLNISAADGGRIVLSHVGAETWVYFGSGANESLVKVTGDVEIGDLITSGTEAGVTIYANAGTENLTGGAGRDILVGGTGTSLLVGGDGADILYGGSGTDTFRYDGLSNSTYAGFDLIVGLETGKDKIDISAMDGGKIILGRYGGSSFIYSAFDSSGVPQSAIVVQGLDLKTTDLITSGGANQPFIVMGDGSGQSIADVLVAGAGHDILYGLDGNDTLTGGGGADFMVGGAGADTFVFTAVTDSAPYATDLIFDFNSSEGDRIDLRPIDANSATPADDAFTVVNSFSKVAGQLIIQTADASGYHHISADVNGDGVADFVLALKVTGTLSASDILL